MTPNEKEKEAALESYVRALSGRVVGIARVLVSRFLCPQRSFLGSTGQALSKQFAVNHCDPPGLLSASTT